MIEFIVGLTIASLGWKMYDLYFMDKSYRRKYKRIRYDVGRSYIISYREDKNNFKVYNFLVEDWKSKYYIGDDNFENYCVRDSELCDQIINPDFGD